MSGCKMRHMDSQLLFGDLCAANGIIKKLRDLHYIITFSCSAQDLIPTRTSFLNFFYNISSSQLYCQSEKKHLNLLQNKQSRERTYQPIDWCKCRYQRSFYSSYDKELLACTKADGHGYYRKDLPNQHLFLKLLSART